MATVVPFEDEKDQPVSITDSYLLKMLGRFLRPYLWQICGVFALLLVVSGLELLMPYLIKLAVDGPIAEGDLSGLVPLGVIYIVAVLVLFGTRFAYTYWLQTIGQNALVNLRQELYEHILKQDLKWFNKTPVGKIVARMSNDIEALTELLSTSIVMVASNFITLMGIIIVMFLLEWRLALLSILVLIPMAGLSIYFRTKIRAISKRFHQVMAEYLAYLNEQFNGMAINQLFGRQGRSIEGFDKINGDYFNAHTGIRDTFTWFSSFLQILTTLGLAVVLWGGGQGVLAGWATIGMLIAFIEYTRRSFEPVMALSEQFAQIQSAFSAGERIARLLETSPEILEADEPQPVHDFDQSVHFEGVTFGYKPGHPVLKGIDLDIQPGQKVAIVGATGAGKTTLVKLLARYYDVNEGGIAVGGVDLRAMSFEDLRRFITVVPQSPYCFNGTIADNLRLFDGSITLEQMQEAAHIARADQFIDKLPGGYDFELLPGGSNLSQGQRQLLALARAIIHSPQSVLVLDEATSSIDTETEEFIQEGLAQVLEGRTSLIIAHRLSTVRDADRILVMKHGQIIEDGNHDSLLEENGLYAQLYQRQFAEGVAAAD